MTHPGERQDLSGSHPTDRVDEETESSPPDLAPAALQPIGPTQDPVFPSLPAGGAVLPTQVEEDESRCVAVPFIRNVFSVVVKPWGLTKEEFLDRLAQSVDLALDGSSASLDQPERVRVQAIASDFVDHHVRRLERPYAIRSAHQHFTVGTLLVSERWVPESRLRHATFRWAITAGHVVELRDARLPVGHLGHCQPMDMRPFGHQAHGDRTALAAFLAYVLDLLEVDLPAPLAAIGDIALNTNQVLTVSGITPYLEGAFADQMHDLVLPLGNHKMDGLHGNVRYWPVRDTNEAVFSVLSFLTGEVVAPQLYRRWLTKQAYSWLSLILCLIGLLVFSLSGNLARASDPPVALVRYLVLAAAVFVAGSFVFTHR